MRFGVERGGLGRSDSRLKVRGLGMTDAGSGQNNKGRTE